MTTPCPRCGYDLSGPIATWTDRCPLDGQCAECGLPFAWGRVLALAEHPWLFEYYWRRKPLRRLARTWFEATRPTRFWREVRLTDPINLCPLGLVVGGLLLAGLMATYAMALAFTYHWSRPRSWPRFLMQTVGDVADAIATSAAGFFAAVLATPLVFVMLPQTLARAKVRPAHIVRIWLYSLLVPLTVLGAWAAAQAVLAAVGWEDAAISFNPWALAAEISPWRHPVLAWIAPTLVDLGLLLLYAGWGAYWSWCGCRLYLRIERPGRVVAALTLIVVQAALAAQLWVWVMTTSPT